MKSGRYVGRHALIIATAGIWGSMVGIECAGTVSRTRSKSGIATGDRILMNPSEALKTFANGKADTSFRSRVTYLFTKPLVYLHSLKLHGR